MELSKTTIRCEKELITLGYAFKSETDTEVLTYLIDHIQSKTKTGLGEAVRLALQQVVGAYAIVVISKNEPDQLVAARKSSPLVVGIGKEGDFFLASDATPIVEYTKSVVYMEDEEIVVINRKNGLKLYGVDDVAKTPYIQELELKLEALEKGGYKHFMLKEIHEQPRSIRDSFRGRLDANTGWVGLGGIEDYVDKLANANRIIMIACGTSWHACLVGGVFVRRPGSDQC